MKTLIASGLLLALTIPALAYGDSVDFDCGNGIEISMRRHVTVTLPQNKQDKPFTLRATGRKLFVNGRKCVFLTDEMYHERQCAKGDESSCEALIDNWPKAKLPKFFRDKVKWQKTCAQGDADACNALKAGWPHEPLPNE